MKINWFLPLFVIFIRVATNNKVSRVYRIKINKVQIKIKMGQETVNAILGNYKKDSEKPQSFKKKIEFSLKNYFAAYLPDGVNKLTKRVRILPVKEGETIFMTQFIHKDRIDGKNTKLHCLDKNEDKPCPYCTKFDELQLVALQEEEGTESRKEKMKEAYKYMANKMYIIEIIDRDEEDWGPKFWRVPISKNKDGIYDKIVDIVELKGDISDRDNGRDLVIQITRNSNGYATVSSIIPEDPSPLHSDVEVMEKWVNSEKTWSDVYSQKPYEYLELILNKKVPKWDKEAGCFVDEESLKDTTDEPIMGTSSGTDTTDTTDTTDNIIDDLPF